MIFRNLSIPITRCDSAGITMTHFPQPDPRNRAARRQLNVVVPAIVKLGDGRRAKANLQTVSENGGLLRMARALREGDFVEVEFQTQSGMVQGMAEMLHPRQLGDSGALQAFRFIAIEDEDHSTLRSTINSKA